MTTVKLMLRTRCRRDGRYVYPSHDTVELDQLSPRARALAEAFDASLDRQAGPVWVQTDGPRGGRYRSEEERAVYGDPVRDAKPAREMFDAWDAYPADSPNDPHWWLERQAAKIPAGVHVVAAHRPLEPSVPVPTLDRELTAEQVVATIRRKQPEIHMTARTWRSYVSRGRAPQPVRHVGRTPLWGPDEVIEWLANRPGRGTRTDLHREQS